MTTPARSPNSLCATCGHVARWHDGDFARRQRRDPNLPNRPCYHITPPADTACACPGFDDSGDVAVRRGAGPSRAGGAVAISRVPLLLLLLIVAGIALLYAYRSQTPALESVALTRAVAEVQAAQVRRVSITPDHATLELANGVRQQAFFPRNDQTIAGAVAEYNAGHPGNQTELHYEPDDSGLRKLGAIVLSLLPALLVAGFVLVLVMSAARRRR